MRVRWILGLGTMIVVTACGRARVGPLSASDAVERPKDAGTATPVDAGFPSDAGFRDGGSPPQPLAEVLTCSLDRDAALEAAVRIVSCSDQNRNRYSVRTAVEAWEGFVLGSFDPTVGTFTGLPHGCPIWRCAAEASDCRDLLRCIDDESIRFTRCFDGEPMCEGDTLAVCLGGRVLPHVDCGALGGTCRDRQCWIGRCSLNAFDVQCNDEGDLSACGGAVTLDCDRFAPGSRCASFYVGGEPPVPWCSPTGMSEAGAYDIPVDCRRGTISFESVSGVEYEYDCIANGYGACNERGCL